jgi:hypothetical protein
LKLTIELSDAIYKRIKTAAGQEDPVSVEAFVQHAIEIEVQRFGCDHVTPSNNADLAALARQVQRLEKGQRTIVALLDSSTTILAALLRGRTARR